MRFAIVAIAACLLVPAAGFVVHPAATASNAAELRTGQATDFSAAKKKAVKKGTKTAAKKPRATKEQYMRAVPAK